MSFFINNISQQRLMGANGDVTSGSIYFYLKDTLTLVTIYEDEGLLTPRANPVLVAAGELIPDIYLDSTVAYRRRIVYLDGSVTDTDVSNLPNNLAAAQTREFVATAAQTDFSFTSSAVDGYTVVFLNGVRLPSSDWTAAGAVVTLATPATAGDLVAIQGFVGFQSENALGDLLASSAGAGEVGTTSGATVQASLTTLENATAVSITDFGATGDGATDDTAAIQAALNSGAKRVVAHPTASNYLITTVISIPAGVEFDAQSATFVAGTAGMNAFTITADGAKLKNAKVQGHASDVVGSFETANGVYVNGADNVEISGCTISGFEYNGVYLRNCSHFRVERNYFHSNRYVSNTSADIITYSSTDHYGGIIRGNFCCSNNSQGIYNSVSGFDNTTLIEGNFCLTFVGATATFVVSPDIERRWGIILGYGTAKASTCINNFIYGTTSGGIYRTGNAAATAPSSMICTGNTIVNTGIDTVQASLSSAICWGLQGFGDVIANNIIEGTYTGGFGATGGISVQPNITPDQDAKVSTLISGNMISNCAGHGILVTAEAINVSVVDNDVRDCDQSPIGIIPTGARSEADFTRVSRNRVQHLLDTNPAIYAVLGSGATMLLTIDDNDLVGLNNTTNSENNSGILVNSVAALLDTTISNNRIRRFRAGIATNFYLAAAYPKLKVSGNRIFDCHTGVAAGGSGTNGRLLSDGNTFDGCTADIGGGPLFGPNRVWHGTAQGGLSTVLDTAAPTAGNWIVGDRTINSVPVVGQPKAWACTVAGNPGTWVSEGNL
jgi:parallel beta-helix repeat protein